MQRVITLAILENIIGYFSSRYITTVVRLIAVKLRRNENKRTKFISFSALIQQLINPHTYNLSRTFIEELFRSIYIPRTRISRPSAAVHYTLKPDTKILKTARSRLIPRSNIDWRGFFFPRHIVSKKEPQRTDDEGQNYS